MTPEFLRRSRLNPEASGSACALFRKHPFRRNHAAFLESGTMFDSISHMTAGLPDLPQVSCEAYILLCRILPERSQEYSRNSGSPATVTLWGFRAIRPLACSKSTGYSISRGSAKWHRIWCMSERYITGAMLPRKRPITDKQKTPPVAMFLWQRPCGQSLFSCRFSFLGWFAECATRISD
jgi:hypothetical protein